MNLADERPEEVASAAIVETLQETEIPGAGGCLATRLRRQGGLFAAAPSGRLGGLLHTAVARGGETGDLPTKHPRRAAEAAPSSSVTPATMNADSTAVSCSPDRSSPTRAPTDMDGQESSIASPRTSLWPT